MFQRGKKLLYLVIIGFFLTWQIFCHSHCLYQCLCCLFLQFLLVLQSDQCQMWFGLICLHCQVCTQGHYQQRAKYNPACCCKNAYNPSRHSFGEIVSIPHCSHCNKHAPVTIDIILEPRSQDLRVIIHKRSLRKPQPKSQRNLINQKHKRNNLNRLLFQQTLHRIQQAMLHPIMTTQSWSPRSGIQGQIYHRSHYNVNPRQGH